MKTFSAKPFEIQRNWFLVDARDKVLGRLASSIAIRLRGKHKPEFTPHIDTGDYIVVINASEILVTGNKEKDKQYFRHTGYVGGIRMIRLFEMRKKFPERIIQKAVKGMMPNGPLGRSMLKKLKIYPSAEHPHSAQKPVILTI